MDFFVTFNQVLVLFSLLLLGILIRKLSIVDKNFGKGLSNFVFNIALPATIIISMNFPFTLEKLMNSIRLVIISLGVITFSYIIAIVVTKILKVDPITRNIFESSLLFPNYAFLGYPVVEALFGKMGLFYASIFNMPFFFVGGTIGIMIMQRREKKRADLSFKKVITAPLVAVIIGFLLFLFPIELPGTVKTVLEKLGATTSPLSMIFAGMVLANSKFKKMFGYYKVYIITFFRLFFIPGSVLLLLSFFDLEILVAAIPVILMAMPVSISNSIRAEKFDNDSYLAAQCAFISTLFSIFTIPLVTHAIWWYML